MNPSLALLRLAIFAIAALLPCIRPAHAIVMKVNVLPPHQVMTSAYAEVGHAVDASTNYNRVAAGGSFVLACAMPNNLPITGERTLFTEGLTGPRRLIVTIPSTVPSTFNIPGFQNLNRGESAMCTYAWRAQATEGGFKVGIPGIDWQSGNGLASEGSTLTFQMIAPPSKDEDTGYTCIP